MVSWSKSASRETISVYWLLTSRGEISPAVQVPLRYLEWEARDLGISLKAMVEALDEIRLGLVRTNEGKPRLAVEQMVRLPARLFSRFQLGDLVPK